MKMSFGRVLIRRSGGGVGCTSHYSAAASGGGTGTRSSSSSSRQRSRSKRDGETSLKLSLYSWKRDGNSMAPLRWPSDCGRIYVPEAYGCDGYGHCPSAIRVQKRYKHYQSGSGGSKGESAGGGTGRRWGDFSYPTIMATGSGLAVLGIGLDTNNNDKHQNLAYAAEKEGDDEHRTGSIKRQHTGVNLVEKEQNFETEENTDMSAVDAIKISNKPQCKAVSIFAARGPRASMEDEYLVSSDGCYFAVYDGHGGSGVARLAKLRIFPEFASRLEKGEKVDDALLGAFKTVSEEVLNTSSLDHQGSTAVTVFLRDNDIWSANLGDSRAVLCRGGRAINLTEDHKPNSPTEKERIEKLGGTVSWYGYLGPDRQPVPGMGAYRMNGNLAVSRALGDRLETPFVSSVPDVKNFARDKEKDHFIVVASDGLWDVMSSQDAVNFVQQILSGSVGALQEGSRKMKVRRPSRPLTQWIRTYSEDRGMVRAVLDTRRAKMAQYLVEESLRRGTADNVTVLVVWLR